MVSPDKRKNPLLRRKGKPKIAHAVITPAASNTDDSTMQSSRPKSKSPRTKQSTSVVNAFVFNHDTPSSLPPKEGALQPINASVFGAGDRFLTFTNKLRNVIEYTFECLRDSVADKAPISPYLARSIVEMKRLCAQAEGCVKPETLRRFKELIEETEAFIRGEKTALTNSDDYEGPLHYRHYVRIAWLTQFILGDLNVSGF